MKVVWCNILAFLLLGTASAQQFPDLRFLHLTDKDGLSSNAVKSIAQDRDGIIWISTENGLNRFDGYGIKNFFARGGDSTAIPDNRISRIITDSNGHLWGTTFNGIFCMDTRTQQIRAFTPGNVDTTVRGNPYHEPYLFLDSSQRPWVSADGGLFHFDRDYHLKMVSAGPPLPGRSWPRKAFAFGGLVRDRNGGLWTCWHDAVFQFDKHLKVVRIFRHEPGILITGIFFDAQNRCWIGTWGSGIFRLDTKSGTWEDFHPTPIWRICYGVGEWTIGSNRYVVFACSMATLLFIGEDKLDVHPVTLDENEVTFNGSPFADREGLLWVPTTSGLYFTTPRNLFDVIRLPQLKNRVGMTKFSYAYNMQEDSTGYWISKRYFGGLFWYNRQWTLLHYWEGVPLPAYGRAMESHPDNAEGYDFRRVGRYMYVTTEIGISVLDLHTLTWTFLDPPDTPGVMPRLRTIIALDDHTWWIRSFDRGVYVFNPLTRRFLRRYSNADTCAGCLSAAVNYIVQSNDHTVYVSTNNGLYRYDPSGDRFRKMSLLRDVPPTQSFFGLMCDHAGRIWCAYANGVLAYNPSRGSVEKNITENNKIGTVFRICEDSHQNIWFGSQSGYWCWLRKQDKVVHFDFGLDLPRTDEGLFYKTSDGLVYGGAKDALVRFYPDRLMNFRVHASARIVEALQDDSVLPLGQGPNGKELVLNPDRSSVSVNFDVINYDLIATNQYFYRLSPGSEGWKQSESGHLAFYDLPPGHYRLEVRGSSKLTGRSTNTDSLDIVVRPHWYQSFWFIFLAALACGTAIALAVRHRIRSIRRDAALKHRMAESEMTALRAQMNPHFIFNSLNCIENFIMKNEKWLASEYLNKFATLIRMILENSRNQVVPLALDMEAMQLYVDLERLRFGEKFRYITDIDPSLLVGDYRVPPLLIQPFVENAIVHGLAPCERDNLYLSISIHLDGDYVRYGIEDNGIGRNASADYNRRYRVHHKSLGLRITRERMDILNTQNRAQGTLEILDLAPSAPGTRVLLTIKVA